MAEPVTKTHPHENDPSATRLIALPDGIYAIAMTLLVIDVAVPAHLDDAGFHKAPGEALPSLGAFALSIPLAFVNTRQLQLVDEPLPQVLPHRARPAREVDALIEGVRTAQAYFGK
nr:TMEM175 family protein [Streptomyces sp. NBC_00886]